MAEPQRDQDDGDSLPATAEQQYRTAFCALKHTRSSYKPAINVDSRLPFDASSEVYGSEDLALAVGSGKDRGGGRSALGEEVKRAGSQREQGGRNSSLATPDSSIKQQSRTVFRALNHTRSSYKPAIYMDSGWSFDASSEVFGGEDLDLAVEKGKVRGGRGSVFGEGVKRAAGQREQDGGDAFRDTTDSSMRQQQRTAFCALKDTRSRYKSAINVDSGLPFDASSKVFWGEDLVLAVGSGRVRRTGRYI